MKTNRVPVPNDGNPVPVLLKESGSYGTQVALYNASNINLELCGDADDADTSWRGFKAGATIFLELDPHEEIFVINNGGSAVEVDWMVSK